MGTSKNITFELDKLYELCYDLENTYSYIFFIFSIFLFLKERKGKGIKRIKREGKGKRRKGEKRNFIRRKFRN